MKENSRRRRQRRCCHLMSLTVFSVICLFSSTANGFSSNSSSTFFTSEIPRFTESLFEKKNYETSTIIRLPLSTSKTRDKPETAKTSGAPDHVTEPPSIGDVCALKAVDVDISEKIKSKISEGQINLLEYQLIFPNHSVNPLPAISMYAYRLDTWARASSQHGQTLLSLAFNYGILSLRTLTFGTDLLVVEMQDTPYGCITALNETRVIDKLLFLLSRDFQDTLKEVTLIGEERICHEVIVDVGGFAQFRDQCFMKGTTGELTETQVGNFWINLLYTLLLIVRFGILFCGPLLLTSLVAGMSKKSIPYVVKLKEALRKKIFLAKNINADAAKNRFKENLILDFGKVRGFEKFKEAIETLPIEEPFDAKITQYDILVSYERLLTENRVPVGLWKSIIRMIFHCKIRNVGPFRKCCAVNMYRGCCCSVSQTPWSHFWLKVGKILMVLCVPIPWYLRLWVFYTHEYSEVLSRKEATAKVGLEEALDSTLIHYFTPKHWIFYSIYVLYILSAIILAHMVRHSEKSRFQRIVTGSFSDLENLSWNGVLEMLVGNVIWPLGRYGLCGVLVGIVYWPIAIPLSIVVFVLFCLPLTYLIYRMFYHSHRVFAEDTNKRQKETAYRIRSQKDESFRSFEIGLRYPDPQNEESKTQDDLSISEDHRISYYDELVNKTTNKHRADSVKEGLNDLQKSPPNNGNTFSLKSFSLHLIASTICILSLISYLVIISECIGCLVEILVFTLMGIIVNAGTLLKYVTLVILVVVYSYDSFNNVEKRYLKLNKALFNEVKGRIKDLDKVTSLPSHLQENRGFKSQELNEQGDYESPDDVVRKPNQHWMINDLVLFVDNEDMPRIPKKLFDQVCQIRVAGVPGPVYIGLLLGVKEFLKIALFIFFVFVVVLSFGDVYKISSTNQMLATLAGGFLPIILRQFMEPERPDIEIGTVSFKSKLDEIIKNFKQEWPIYDFPLEENTEEPTEQNEGEASKDSKSDNPVDHSILHLEDETKKEIVQLQGSNYNGTNTNTEKKVTFETSESSMVDLVIILPQTTSLNRTSNPKPLYPDESEQNSKQPMLPSSMA